MSYIIYPQQNNKLAVIMPFGDINDSIKDVPANTPYTIVESLSHIDDEYFDGYIYDDGYAIPHIESCKNIHLNKFREARKMVFEKLDVDYMRALEVNDTIKLAEIALQKQELRDVTGVILPDTLEEIKLVWPDILKA